MEARSKLKESGQRRAWFDQLCERADAALNGEPGFTLPMITWWNPTQLTKEEKYQVCCILFSFQLSLGVSTDEFERQSAQPNLLEGNTFYHKFKEGDREYETRSLVKVIKCNSPTENSEITEQVRQSCVRLILVTLEMFSITVDYYIRVQQLGWETENQN